MASLRAKVSLVLASVAAATAACGLPVADAVTYEWFEYSSGDRRPSLPRDEIGASGLLQASTAGVPGGPAAKPPHSVDILWREEFAEDRLSSTWILFSAPAKPWWRIKTRKGGRIALEPSVEQLTREGKPSYLARRIEHSAFRASTEVEIPGGEGVSAGLVVFQSDGYHSFLGTRRVGNQAQVFLERVEGGASEVVTTAELPEVAMLRLRVEGEGEGVSFAYAIARGQWIPLTLGPRGARVRTRLAGGFAGVTVGLYARRDRDE